MNLLYILSHFFRLMPDSLILKLYFANRMYRTRFFTQPATDTFQTIGIFHRIHLHLANLCTDAAARTFLLVHLIPEYRDRIEYRVNGAKRTYIFTKRSVY